ncbi:unnamed protein product [Diamesa tonsa]
MKAYLVFGLFLGIIAVTSAQKKVVCYWGSWASNLPASNINTNICTHVIYSFVGVTKDGSINGINDAQLNTFSGLKSKNPQIKLMVAVGGANFGPAIFSELAKFPLSRSNFAKNSVAFLQRFKLDGLDLDWEYPVEVDKANFILLLTELKRQLSANNLIFSIAVAAGQWTSDKAYDIPKIHAQVDFINLMTYDLHGAWEAFTGHNAPMYNDPVSVDVCVKYWISKGAPRDKLILGIATYGRLFTLANSNNNGFDAPAVFTGTMNYNEICRNNWQRVWSDLKQVPYKFSGNQWIGYDDVESVSIKAKYSNSQNLGGVMIWSMESDDVAGSCGQGTFPLIKAVYQITMGNEVISSGPSIPISPPIPPTPTNPVGQAFTCPIANGLFADPTSASNFYNCGSNIANLMACGSGMIWNNPKKWLVPTTVTVPIVVTTSPVNQPFQCPSDGLFADPTNCSKYYSCGNGIAYSMPCNDGLKWNKVNQYCDHAYNVQC